MKTKWSYIVASLAILGFTLGGVSQSAFAAKGKSASQVAKKLDKNAKKKAKKAQKRKKSGKSAKRESGGNTSSTNTSAAIGGAGLFKAQSGTTGSGSQMGPACSGTVQGIDSEQFKLAMQAQILGAQSCATGMDKTLNEQVMSPTIEAANRALKDELGANGLKKTGGKLEDLDDAGRAAVAKATVFGFHKAFNNSSYGKGSKAISPETALSRLNSACTSCIGTDMFCKALKAVKI